MANNNKNKKPKKNSEVNSDEQDKLKDFVEKIELFYDDFNEHIYRARNYLTFLYVDQWDQDVRRNRDILSKPTLQFNKLTTIVRAILGEQRNKTPDLAVRDISTDFKAPQQTVDSLTDHLREISYQSNADILYQLTFKQMVEIGWGGNAVVRTKYEDSEGFKQCIYIDPISDFQSVFWDPFARYWDKSDGDYCGLYQIMSREKFKREYTNVENVDSLDGANTQYYLPWLTDDGIVVGEIWVKEYFNKTIVEFNNGKTLEKNEANELLALQEKALEENENLKLLGYQEIEIVNERTVKDYKIRHYKFVKNNILDDTDWPGKILPIPYADGDFTVIDGRRIPVPYIQDAIDTQKMINYVGSEIAYAILRSRKETVIGVEENFEGNPEVWQNPDQVQGPLTYKIGNKGEKPEFISPPVFSPVLLETYNNSTQDIAQVLGRYEESRGQQSNAQSGIAIAKRQSASNLPINVYQDNLARYIKQIGRIIIDMHPNVYDTERKVIVRGADGNTNPITFNQRKGLKLNEYGEMEDVIHNDVSKGKYDIDVRVDGSFDEQTAAALEFFLRLSSTNPQVGNLIPDLIAEVSGLENTKKLIERLETLVPPDILAKEKGLPPPPPPPQPAPPPEIIIAQLKAKTDMEGLQIKQQELAQKQAELILEMQLKGLDYKSAFNKSLAEIIKSHNEVKQTQIEHISTVVKSRNDTFQKLIGSEAKRADINYKTNNL